MNGYGERDIKNLAKRIASDCLGIHGMQPIICVIYITRLVSGGGQSPIAEARHYRVGIPALQAAIDFDWASV